MKRCSEYYVGSGFAAVGNGVADVDGDGYGFGYGDVYGFGYGSGNGDGFGYNDPQATYEDQEVL